MVGIQKRRVTHPPDHAVQGLATIPEQVPLARLPGLVHGRHKSFTASIIHPVLIICIRHAMTLVLF